MVGEFLMLTNVKYRHAEFYETYYIVYQCIKPYANYYKIVTQIKNIFVVTNL